MAYELKTKKTDASVDAYIDTIEDESKRDDAREILKMMKEVTGEEPKMWSSMVGFGTYTYKYASGTTGEWFRTGFAARKGNITLYIMPGFDLNTLPGKLMEKLGKYKTGKSCLYIKKLTDVDVKVLRQMVEGSMEHMKEMYPT